MPTKRIPFTREQEAQITPDVLRAFRAGDAVLLQSLLGRRPWQASPLDCPVDRDPPAYMEERVAADWRGAQGLRRQLLDADRTARAASRNRQQAEYVK